MVSKGKYKPFIFCILCIMIVVTYSCTVRVYKYKDMTYYKKQFASGQIRTDGYYTYRLEDEDSLMHVFCFYKDGFALNCGIYSIDDTTLTQNLIMNAKRGFAKNREWWQVYCIENDTITIQCFSENLSPKISVAGLEYYLVLQSKGVVINSEKFKIFEDVYNGKTEKINATYQFHPCVDCKPDSTNWLRTNKKLNKLYSRIE